MIECSWKSTFGIECMTCGFQRSFWMLLKGNFYESFVLFPATIPFLLACFVATIHIFKPFKKGPVYIVTLFGLTAILMVINYTYKIWTGQINA